MALTLRPYQQRAIDDTRAHVAAGRQRVLLVAPTGAGKTVVAVGLIERALARGRRVIMVAHRRELIRQPYERLLAAGLAPEQVGVILAGVGAGGRHCDAAADGWGAARARPEAPVQVAGIDTLRRRELPQADIVIIDEAHRTLAASYRWLCDQYPDAVVLGLTATPVRSDRHGLGEIYQAMVVVASYAELVAEGHLVAPRVFSTRALPDLTSVRIRGEDYAQDQLAAACDRAALVGDVVEHWQRLAAGRPTLAFGVGIEHSTHLRAAFTAARIAAVHVDGTTPTAEREAAWRGLADGSVAVVCNCDVASEGLDVPAVKCVISARPTASLRIWLQQCGRGSRPYEGQEYVILDHAGNALRHGLPQEDRVWSLEGRKARTGAARPRPVCWRCEECDGVSRLASRICEHCGAARPAREAPEWQPGELIEIAAGSGLDDQQRAAAWRLVLAEWRTRNARGGRPSKPGWCYYRMRERYRCDPPRGGETPAWTTDEAARAQQFDRLRERAQERGYDPRWAHVRMAQGERR